MNKREAAFKKATIDDRMIRNNPDPMAPTGVLSTFEPAKWEYQSLVLPRQADRQLSELGAAGWELVSVTPQPADQAAYYFKRIKTSEKP